MYNAINGVYVKIAILFDESNAKTVHIIKGIIERHDCKVFSHPASAGWRENHESNPLVMFKDITHALFVYTDKPGNEAPFLFYSGFCLGHGIRVLLLRTGCEAILPEHCRYLGTELDAESFEDFFIHEIVRFETEDRKIIARKALIDRGISCFDESFISIVMSGDAGNAELFLKAGFSPSITDMRGLPLLSIAVRSQFPEIVSLLIKNGADVNRPSGDRGYSPLMDAVQKGDAVMCELLLENRADPNLKSKDGQTALVICTGRGDVRIAELLVASGADPSIADNLGLSAGGYAKLFKNEKLMDLFNARPA